MTNPNEEILYDGIDTITRYNYESLSDGVYIQDVIIQFQLHRLEKKYNDLHDSNYFHCIMPYLTQFMQSYPFSTVQSSLDKEDLSQYKLTFFPLADFNTATLSATHFSLIYLDNRNGEMKLKHFDSHHQYNLDIAKQLAAIIAKLYDLPSSDLEPINSAQQTNGFDCGVYVMSFIDNLIEAQGDINQANCSLTPQYVTNYRHEIRDYIPIYAEQIKAQKK